MPLAYASEVKAPKVSRSDNSRTYRGRRLPGSGQRLRPSQTAPGCNNLKRKKTYTKSWKRENPLTSTTRPPDLSKNNQCLTKSRQPRSQQTKRAAYRPARAWRTGERRGGADSAVSGLQIATRPWVAAARWVETH